MKDKEEEDDIETGSLEELGQVSSCVEGTRVDTAKGPSELRSSPSHNSPSVVNRRYLPWEWGYQHSGPTVQDPNTQGVVRKTGVMVITPFYFPPLPHT